MCEGASSRRPFAARRAAVTLRSMAEGLRGDRLGAMARTREPRSGSTRSSGWRSSLPMVFILLTHGLPAHAGRAGRSDLRVARRARSAERDRRDQGRARLRQADLQAVLRLPGPDRPRRSRHDHHRSPSGNGHRSRERRCDAGADVLRDDRRDHRGRHVRSARRSVPRHVDRRRRAAVRDRHLRDARLLPRAHGAALLRLVPRLASDLRSGEPDRRRRRSRPTPGSTRSTRSSTATGARSRTRSSTWCCRPSRSAS